MGGDSDAFTKWLGGLRDLTDSVDASKRWRERRFEFAFRLGQSLVAPVAGTGGLSGPAVYGIWLTWGLLYVGQTTEAGRRLRDLPVGESHHLANTFPPEIWDRVVVVDWPALPEAESIRQGFDDLTIGLALEHRLQVRHRPLANAYRRTAGGEWREVDRTVSGSRGARAANEVNDLADHVERLWDRAAYHEKDEPLPESVRCVRPRQLLGLP